MKKIKEMLLVLGIFLLPTIICSQPPIPPNGPKNEDDVTKRHNNYSYRRTPVGQGTLIILVLGLAFLVIDTTRNVRKEVIARRKDDNFHHGNFMGGGTVCTNKVDMKTTEKTKSKHFFLKVLKKKLKIPSLFICILLVSCSVFAHDFSATDSNGNVIYYNITSASVPYTVEVTYEGNTQGATFYTGENYVIPSIVSYSGITYTVTKISEYAFYNCTGVTSIELPATIETIGSYAFYGCISLRKIRSNAIIPPTANSYTFTNVPAYASIYIPCGKREDYKNAFYWQSFKYYIEGEVVKIDDLWYEICGDKATVVRPMTGDSTYKTAPNFISGSLVIPDTVVYEGNTYIVTAIASGYSVDLGVFRDCEAITSVTFPSTLKVMGNYAFQGCKNIRSVTFLSERPPVITNGYYWPFEDSLDKYMPVFVPCGTKGDYQNGNWSRFYRLLQGPVFKVNGLWYNVTCENPYTATVIRPADGDYTYKTAPNTVGGVLTIPATVTDPEDENKVYKVVAIEDGDPYGYNTGIFSECVNLTGVDLSNAIYLESIGVRTFQNCRGIRGNITIPNSVTNIGMCVFAGCTNLDGTITFPANSSYTTIKDSMLNDCFKLKSIILPENIASIERYAFSSCGTQNTEGPLLKIYAHREEPPTATSWQLFHGLNNTNCNVYVPCGVEPAYRSAYGWKDLNILGGETKKIGHLWYELCLNGAVIIRPEDGDRTYNTSPNKIEGTLSIPATIIDPDSGVEYDVVAIKDAPTDDASKGVFANCHAINYLEFSLPSNLKRIGNYAFMTTGLPDGSLVRGLLGDIIIPNSVESMGYYVFSNQCNIRGIVSLPENTHFTTIPEGTFNMCKRIKTAIIPQNVTEIRGSAFSDAYGSMRGLYFKGTVPPTLSADISSGIASSEQPFSNWSNASIVPDSVKVIPVYIPCGSLSAYNNMANTQSANNKLNDGICTKYVEIELMEKVDDFWYLVTCADNDKARLLQQQSYTSSYTPTVKKSLTIPEKITTNNGNEYTVAEIDYKAFTLLDKDMITKIEFESETPLKLLNNAHIQTNDDGVFDDVARDEIYFTVPCAKEYKNNTYSSAKTEWTRLKYLNYLDTIKEPVFTPNSYNGTGGFECYTYAKKPEKVIITDDGSLALKSYDDLSILSDTVEFELYKTLTVRRWNLLGSLDTALTYGGVLETEYKHDFAVIPYVENDWRRNITAGGRGIYAKVGDTLINKQSFMAWPYNTSYVYDSTAMTYPTIPNENKPVLFMYISPSNLQETKTNNGEFTYTNTYHTSTGVSGGSDGKTGRWFALYNPYIARMDAYKFKQINDSQIQGEYIYCYNSSLDQWEKIPVTAKGVSEIYPANGFMVASKDDNPSINIKMNNTILRRDTPATNRYKADIENTKIKLSAIANETENEAFVSIQENASNGFDGRDSYLMVSNNRTDFVEPYFLVDDRKIFDNHINNLPYEVELRFHSGGVSTTDLKLTNIPNNIGVSIIDIQNGEETELGNEDVFTFIAYQGENAGRYKIKFYTKNVSLPIMEEKEVDIRINLQGETLSIYGEDLHKVVVVNTLGQTVLERNLQGNHSNIKLSTPSGAYIVKVYSTKGNKSQKIIMR
ncbi:MAG: leucine-rich repeat domain-containing protein [Bacteroidales bacterium]|nr:leucine-rich repeat domain-containing protein [Bacteroidales bacterium]